MKKIDIHCHTTNRKIKDVLSESVTPEAIIEKMKEHDVEKTVVLATYFPHKTSGISNFRLLHWIKDKPEFHMFGSLDFEYYFYQGLNELTELAENNLIKGIKIYTCYQNIDLKSDKVKQIISLAKENSLPLMFHCGYSYSAKRKYGKPVITNEARPSDLEFIAKENPKLNLILSHMAKPFFEDLNKVIQNNPNVYTDVSGLLDSKFEAHEVPKMAEVVKGFLGECGSKQLLFGSDFPVQTYEDSIYFIEEAMKDYPESEKQDVYYNNARKLLRD